MNDPWLQLTKLEVFFIATTLISLFFNVFQAMIWWRDQKNLFRPLSNSLVALFNDIKAKSLHCFFVQNTLWNPNNPHKEMDTLRWEYGAFTQTMITALQGFQESVVGVYTTLNPDDKDGAKVFRAADYGLTQQEREFKQKNLERLQAQSAGPAPAAPAPAAEQGEEEATER